MILAEPAPSAANTKVSGSKQWMTMQPPNMQRFLLTILQRPSTQVNFRSAAIESTCEQVIAYSDEEKVPIVIASSKVEEQVNPVKEFPNLFLKPISTKLLPLGQVNPCINSTPVSQWLPTWWPSTHKLGEQINYKLNAKVESEHLYTATNAQNAVLMLYIAKQNQPYKPGFVTECCLRKRAVYKKEPLLPNIKELIKQVGTCSAWSEIDLADGYFYIGVEESSEKWGTIQTTCGMFRSWVMSHAEYNAPGTII